MCAGARIEVVCLAHGHPEPLAQLVVGFEQLHAVADVEPPFGEAIGVNGLAFVQPCDHAAGLVGRVARLDVFRDQRHVLAVVEVGRGRSERRPWVLRLLDEGDDAVVRVDVDDPVARRELERADVADCDHARDALRAPECDEVGEAELEEVVARDHEQVVVDPGALDDEPNVADRAEAVLVRHCPVVVDRDVAVADPLVEPRRLARVRHDVHRVHLRQLGDALEDPVDDRPATDRQELLRGLVGQRAEAGRVARREDDDFHAAAVSAARDSSYGA
jgi:hypothetical protein